MTDQSVLSYDLGTLAVFDLSDQGGTLAEKTTRSVQGLVKQFFDAAFKEASSGAPVACIRLPKTALRLPRAKPVPKMKEKTKWEKFAELKGIQKRKRGAKVYDEHTREWTPRHGGKSAKNRKINGWCEEVN